MITTTAALLLGSTDREVGERQGDAASRAGGSELGGRDAPRRHGGAISQILRQRAMIACASYAHHEGVVVAVDGDRRRLTRDCGWWKRSLHTTRAI